MEIRRVFLVFILSFCVTAAFTQSITDDTSFKTITVSSEKDATFDKTIDYLQASDFFIQSVDKQAGFVQATIFLKEKRKILSVKEGERRTMNFILRPAEEGTRIVLNIYSETCYFGGDISTRTHYYEDNGIIDDAVVYQDILDGLLKTVRP